MRFNSTKLIAALENLGTNAAPTGDVAANLKNETTVEDEIQAVVGADAGVTASPAGTTTELGPKNNGEGNAELAPQEPAKPSVLPQDGVDQGDVEGAVAGVADTVVVKDAIDPAKPATENIVENEGESTIPSQTVEADTAPEDIDAAVDAITDSGIGARSDEFLEESDGVADDLERFESVAAALERYQAVVGKAIADKGFISAETAETIRIGLEAFSMDLFGQKHAPTVPSNEGFASPVDRIVVSNELLENLQKGAAQVGAVAKEALAKLIQLILDAWAAFTQDAGKLKERLDALDAKAGTVGKANKDKIAIKGAARLTIGGEFSAKNTQGLKNLKEVATELLVTWPGSFQKTLTDIMASAKAGDNTSFQTKLAQALKANVSGTFKTAKPIPDAQASSAMSDYDLVYRSAILPGDYALFVGINENAEAGDDTVAMLQQGGKALNIDFSRIDGASAQEQGEFVVDVPNPAEMKGMVKALREIVDGVIENQQGREKYKALAKGMSTMGTGLKIEGFLRSNEDVTAMGNLYQSIAKHGIAQNRPFLGYLFNTVKAHIAVLEAFVGHHEAPAEA
jgi:hypothetical protein